MRRLVMLAGVIALLAATAATVGSTPAGAGGGSHYGLTADLSGGNEVGGGDPDGAGSAYVRLNPSTGQVCFTLAAQNVGTINGAHIHSGGAGVNGAIVVDFDFLDNGLEGCVSSTVLQVQQILQDPASFYVNLHTGAFPGGAIRGQLGITVTGTTDAVSDLDGVLSLREAFNTANNDNTASTITLGLERTYQLTVCGADDNTNVIGDLDHVANQSLTIMGNGSTVEQTCDDARVIHSTSNFPVDVHELTVQGGDAVGSPPGSNGGGISVAQNLALTDAVVTLNASTGSGGGVNAGNDLIVERSYIANNAAVEGGGIRGGQALVVSSTIAGNDASIEGGGVSGGDIDLKFVTLRSNSAPTGAHVSGGTLESFTSIFTDNLGGGAVCDMGVSSATLGGNYIHTSTPGDCNYVSSSDTVTTTPPDLRPLFPAVPDSTSAYIPNEGSPVLERVFGTLLTCTSNVDQRGLDRPQNTDCDAGSIELEDCAGFFSDVDGTSQFCFEIGWMAATGVSTGFSDGTYRPSPAVTRAAMSAFMYRLAGEPAFDPPGSPTFSDVPTTSQFFTEIEWMNDEGITTGFPGGLYKPSQAVSRQAMSAFMYRLAGEPPFADPPTPSFSDVPTTSQFFTEIEWMNDEGITTGFPGGLYKPSQAVSRQAMSAFMYRLADGLLPGQ